jgi:phasin family protein
MSNDALKLYKELSEQTVASVKSLSELNLRTFETMAAKQVEILQHCVEAGMKQADVMKAAKDPNALLAAQSELATACAEQFNTNMVETADIFKTAQEELSGLVEASVADARENARKFAELSKKGVDEVVQAAKPAKTTRKAA